MSSQKRKYDSNPSRSSYSRKQKRVRYSAMASKVSIPAVLRARRGEIKSLDIPLTNSNINSTGSLSLLNAMSAGAEMYTRIGRKVSMKSLRLTGEIALRVNGGTVNFGDYCRIILVYDRQPTGSTPAVSDVLLTIDGSGTGTTTSYSGPNLNNSDRFYIIRDKRIALSANNGGAAASTSTSMLQGLNEQSLNVDMYCKLKGLETHFKAATSFIADFTTGSLFLLLIGSNSSTNSVVDFNWTSRLRYNDS